MKSALITGATGFIGGRLAHRLAGEGWAVHTLLRPNSDPSGLPAEGVLHRYDGSLENLTEIFRASRPEVVFHLASLYLAEHKPEQVDALVSSNILFPAQLAEAMTNAGATRLVNTGTAWQHFGTNGYNPVNLYAATKQACEELLRYFHDARGLSVVTLKLFDTFGAGDKRRKLVQLLVDAATSGERIGLSPGHQILVLTYIDDVVDAFLAAATRLLDASQPLSEAFLLDGERLSLRELVASVEQALGRSIDAEFGARPYRPREVMCPIEPGEEDKLPGWEPAHRLSDVVPNLVGT